jgi:hypothetical protein
MFEPSSKEIRQFHLLVVFSLLCSALFAFVKDQHIEPGDFFPPGKALISVSDKNQEQVWGDPTIERGPRALSRIAINQATEEELRLCPGIGPVMAGSIIRARTKKTFSDWEDLQNRVSGMGTVKILRLQEAGVQLDL